MSKFIRIFSVFFVFSALARLVIAVLRYSDFSLYELPKSFLVGEFFDFITFSYIIGVHSVFFLLIPDRFFKSNIGKFLLSIKYFIFCFIVIFVALAEWFFWEEFSTKFNFIAVDYLIYTKELIGNSIESYPVYKALIGIAILALFITFKKIGKYSSYTIIKEISDNVPSEFIARLKLAFPFILLTILDLVFVNSGKITDKFIKNVYNRELAKNGMYEFCSAFWHNSIDYERNYLSLSNQDILEVEKSVFKDRNFKEEDITYHVYKADKTKPENLKNVILVLSESMSADYLEYFDENSKDLTKNLGEIAKESLFFDNLFATGTRTVRGIEATTLSIAPTPGQSIVRRKEIDNLFNIGTPFKQRGYDVKFIYGGYGYFDNMNAFFERNGFKTIDRLNMSKDEIHFGNVWGICDEDLFDKVIKEADESFGNNKKFFSYTLTTSNHRPFTYPDGKIDIPSQSGRNGGVKYSDYAFGEFIKKTKTKPWFKDTIIVFVADHCSGSAGKTNLPMIKYRIPLFFYSPGFIKPKIVSKLSSQIDLAPTLFGILNFEYDSKFIGQNILSENFQERAFIGSYQNLGYIKGNEMCLVGPKKIEESFEFKKDGKFKIEQVNTKSCSEETKKEMIFYYQFSSEIFKSGKMKLN